MNFKEAEKLAHEGHKIAHRSWVGTKPYHYIFYDKISDELFDSDELFMDRECKHLTSDDWVIYEKPVEKTYTFTEAIIAFTEGKNIKRTIHTYAINKEHFDVRKSNFSLNDVIANDWLIMEEE